MSGFVPSEDFECKCFSRWLQTQPVKFSHLPLETLTDPISAARNKHLGVHKGVPDYLLIVGGRVVFIEMKRSVGGVVSKQQKEWISALNAAGVGAYVCHGFREARELVSNLLARAG